jgi:hypothetical protein
MVTFSFAMVTKNGFPKALGPLSMAPQSKRRLASLVSAAHRHGGHKAVEKQRAKGQHRGHALEKHT